MIIIIKNYPHLVLIIKFPQKELFFINFESFVIFDS